MALIISAQSGTFTNASTWVGGVVPSVGDEAQVSNTHIVTIDSNVTCDEISNTGSGRFTLSGGVTLQANVSNKSAFASNNFCLGFSAASPASATITGTIQNKTSASGTNINAIASVNNSGSGTLNVVGNCLGASSGQNGTAVLSSSTGTTNITGSIIGGGSNNNSGASLSGAGIITITGNCTGGTQGGGNPAHGVSHRGSGTITISGNCTGVNGSGASNDSNTGLLNITGTCTGGSAAGGFGAQNFAGGTMTIVGTIQASQFEAGVSSATRSGVTLLTGPFLTSSPFGVNPNRCISWRWAASLNPTTFIEVPTSNLSLIRRLVTDDAVNGMPTASNVRSGVVYGPSSSLTGTAAIPAAGSVALGVPVDATTGTAVLSVANFQTALDAQGLTTARASNLDNLDAAVSSRSTLTASQVQAAVLPIL